MTHQERPISRRAILQMAVPLTGLAILNPMKLAFAQEPARKLTPNKSWGRKSHTNQ